MHRGSVVLGPLAFGLFFAPASSVLFVSPSAGRGFLFAQALFLPPFPSFLLLTLPAPLMGFLLLLPCAVL